MHDYSELEEFLNAQGIRFDSDVTLKEYTTFRLGGAAKVFVQPRHADELALLQAWLAGHALPVFLLGGGSNLLVSDEGFAGVVIHPQFGEEPRILHQSTDRLQVYVPASARAPLAGKKISAKGFAGLEFLTTIPGHFGGSVIQNAGCYGHELKDSLVNVELAHQGNAQTLPNIACDFRYRDSLFKRDSSYWIAGATLELPKGDAGAIEARIAEYKARRIASQPKNRRSAGSIFKNPPADISDKKAWQLIEAANLRGVKEGGAEISAEHCNFIVNNGHATAADVYKLIRLAEQRVFEATGVRLEREVVLVGNFAEL
ncbi:UDP-N-acetylmuramate dehydrogenase [Turneriella parva]|uniref:UDP-N-acetylenolpyruvoylglucosamine reductase n=1 Tax=Turneriella parva (strain ATCC BAA-1111 / DSM 21527 / NCTC 11395 / H) TaxID=869212 RepID=I4B0Q8_TURPD|nr:UDP-N-acetylmuramate dehydrogenase [Turneriella parva]AFM10865.1 UDP-N-acetylmuramate dehydrogenase [Turneriella parva DSM 21527]